MKYILLIVFWAGGLLHAQDGALKTIHVFVALCDNQKQGIVPVSKALGNGQDPKTNLYWGALYGVKTHFKKSEDWSLLGVLDCKDEKILERLLFKHRYTETYMLAEAYDGRHIQQATVDFLSSAKGALTQKVIWQQQELFFGGSADMMSYIGHNGLMEFELDLDLTSPKEGKRDAIVLACMSKPYFESYLKDSGARPLVWSTGLMSPEAYTLKWALDGWILGETDKAIRERAAQAYHHYQKCGLKAARNLLVSGF